MAKGKRTLTDDEKRLWKQVARTVTPLADEPEEEEIEEAQPTAPARRETARATAPLPVKKNPAPLPELKHGEYAGVDRRTADKFRKGKYEIDATLDLHGYNRDEAHEMLLRFIAKHHKAGSRCLLLITGKGKTQDAPGVLRSMVPRWLADDSLRPMVLAFDSAKQQHGGMGAYYILLKRTR